MGSQIVVENRCAKEKIDGIFFPVIEDAIAAYQGAFLDSIINTTFI